MMLWRLPSSALNFSAVPMDGEAGHDAAEFENQGAATAMGFVRSYHGSHNSLEDMSLDAFLAWGCNSWRKPLSKRHHRG